MKSISYEIMPDNYFPGVQSARSGYGGDGSLLFHFNSDEKLWNRVKQLCIDSGYDYADTWQEMPDLARSGQLPYRYAIAIKPHPFLDITKILHQFLTQE